MTGEAIDPAALQAEAESYQAEYLNLEKEKNDLGVRAAHNKRRGLKLIASMRAARWDTVQVGAVVLRPHHDDNGFERFKLAAPTGRSPHASR